ncbi:unnamed protein product [Diplocarpon coronariae]
MKLDARKTSLSFLLNHLLFRLNTLLPPIPPRLPLELRCKIPLSSLNIYVILAYAFPTLTASFELVEKPIPAAYKEYCYIFSKAASNILPPYRPYNYKIELTAEGAQKALRYSPLYKISIPKLEIVKAYLINNLNKGFIKASSASYAAPFLDTTVTNGSLRFYINYYMLNNLTYKDRYSLPLIDKTLARLQAFHRIRMDPDFKELTTFRTQYSAYKYNNYYPIKYFLKIMNNAKLNYPIYNKELLAIFKLFY